MTFPVLNYYIIAIAGIISIPVFLAYRMACAWISEGCYKFSFNTLFKKKFFVFVLIFIISIVILSVLFDKYGYGIQLLGATLFAYLMLTLAAIDFETQILPDIITKPLIFLGVLQGYFGLFTDLQSSALGAFAGYFLLWSVNLCFRMVRGIDGMGYGDFKLLSAICAWTGIKMLPLIILFSSIVGIFVALVIIKTTKSNIETPTPFGPSLVFTGFIAFVYGNDIMSWYLELLQIN